VKILHIAPFNTAGVPYTLMTAERELGFESRLVTLGSPQQGRVGDISLNLPFMDSRLTRLMKKLFTPRSRLEIKSHVEVPDSIPPVWKPGEAEAILIKFREAIWFNKINNCINTNDLTSFDVVQLDGGLGFYRNSRFVKSMAEAGKKIICCYTGSDLRTRGVIPEIDDICSTNVTVEFDHLQFHPDIHHVPFPFRSKLMRPVNRFYSNTIRIGHAPTNRAAKGSNIIIPIIGELIQNYPVELVLIENLSHTEAIKLKSTCDIFVDQIGNLGFGINSLEAIAMSIPACSSLAPGFEKHYPAHPFIKIDGENLKDQLIRLITNPRLRAEAGFYGRQWVLENHDPLTVVKKIHEIAEL